MTLRIAIIGAGLIGPRHAQSVISNPFTELVAIVDPAPTGAKTASELGTCHFPSIAAMLDAIVVPKPDAAIVCTPNHSHVSVTKELLARNLHVLVEKPISDNVQTGRELLQYYYHHQDSSKFNLGCQTKSKPKPKPKLLVGHHRRFNAYVVKTKQILESGSLGPIIALNGLWTVYKPDAYFAPPGDWRRFRSSGGGVIHINLVHDIDVLHYLFGPIVRVYAEKAPSQRYDYDTSNPAHDDAEEGAAITLRFASGVVGTFLVCDATPSPHYFEAGTGENPAIPQCSGADVYRIFGANASLSVPDMTRWSYDGRSEKSWNQPLRGERVRGQEEESEEHEAPLDLQLAHFVNVVHGNEEPSCSVWDGLRALIVCDAVRRAMETGQPVDIEDDLGENWLRS